MMNDAVPLTPIRGHRGTAWRYDHGCRCDSCKAAAARKRKRAAERRLTVRDRSEIPHGTKSGYIAWHCRCDACKDANSNYGRARRAENAKHVEDAPHGTVGAYNDWHCRCEACRSAAAVYRAQRKASRSRCSPILASPDGRESP